MTGVELVGGKEPRKLVIAEYTDAWPRRFEEHRAKIVDALGTRVRSIDHIGSTSVPGLAAKPIVDICIGVDDVDDEDAYFPELFANGYELRVREPGHRMFRTPVRDVHVHVYTIGDPQIAAYLRFRNRLRADPEDRARYEALKRELVQREWADMNDYADAKGPLVEEIKSRG